MRSRGLGFLFCFALTVKQRQFDQVTFEQRPRGREGVNFENIREMSIPFKRNSKREGRGADPAQRVSGRNASLVGTRGREVRGN